MKRKAALVQSSSKRMRQEKIDAPPTVTNATAALVQSSPKRMRQEKMDAPQTVTNATTFLDLNDDCLFEVFKHFDVVDLSAVSDVCNRLRRTAHAYFERSKLRNFEFPLVIENPRRRRNRVTVDLVISETCKILRKFGAFIVSFIDTNELSRDKVPGMDDESKKKYRSKCMEYLVKYCGANLIELSLTSFELPDEETMRPLLKNVQKLELCCCKNADQLLKALPVWCPLLRELAVVCMDLRSEKLNMRFEKLTKMSIRYCGVERNDIKEFLECNSQLKEFEYFEKSRPDNLIPQYICRYVTETIETLNLGFGYQFQTSPYPSNAIYLRRLRNLKSVTLSDQNPIPNVNCLLPVISDIVAANIPLKALKIDIGFAYTDISHADLVADKISAIKTLETLELRAKGCFQVRQIHQICKNLTKLTKLVLDVGALSALDIVDIVQLAEKLQWLTVSSRRRLPKKICIDADIHKTLSEIVAKRARKTRLEISLVQLSYSVKMTGVRTVVHKHPGGLQKYSRFELP